MPTARHDGLTEECREESALAWRAPGLSARTGGVRFFESAVAEAFTSGSPLLPYAVVVPLVAWLAFLVVGAAPESLRESVARAGAWGAFDVAVPFVAGGLAWTLVEYAMHRFLFHLPARGHAGKVATFLVHGHHHVHPHDARRIAATPLQFGSLLALFFGVVSVALAAPQSHAALAGFSVAYLAYEAIHFAAHHGRPRTPWMRAIKRHHLRHHFERPDARFGISSPLWDVVFGTNG